MSNIQKKQGLSQPFRVVIVGHVDHGKSTLIGRLLHDTGSLPEGKAAEIEAICKARGTSVVEWSFVLDAFQAERDQAVTIDTTQMWFSTQARDYVIIDAPGHREFLKNMVSGAAQADAAILVVDASEGIREQTKRHAYVLSLLGLRQIAVAVNKMDMTGYSAERFTQVSREVDEYLKSIGLSASFIVPISARHGDTIVNRNPALDWYKGKTLTEILDSFDVEMPPLSRSLRFPVQDVYRFEEKRILVGRLESGILRKGDTILFSPTNEKAVVTSIETWPDRGDEKVEAHAGESIGITLDERIFVERGHIGSHDENAPMLSNVFRSNIFWLSKNPLKVGNSYKIRYGTFEAMVTVQSIDRAINTDDLSHTERASEVTKNAVAEITFRARDLLPIDPYADNMRMGRMVIYEGYDIAGGGVINMEGYADQRRNSPKSDNIYMVDHLLSTDARAAVKGHKGGIFWFTGLSGAGKSTLAMAVEKALFERGYHSYVLDGDNVRHGLNSDLGFSPEDRAENIRRVGEVASLMADAGLIVITAFISPYQADRARARSAAPSAFHEIYVKADLETCEGRDPKGLYKKARAGGIKEFTGIDSPYEAPDNPEMVVNTQHNDVATCVQQILSYVTGNMALPQDEQRNTRKEKAIAG